MAVWSDLYLNSTNVFFLSPVFSSLATHFTPPHTLSVLFSTICCKKLICQKDKIFKDVEEEAHQHCFCPTIYFWREARGQLAMKNMASFFKQILK